MTDNIKTLVESLRASAKATREGGEKGMIVMTNPASVDASADLIEQQAARITALNEKCALYEASLDQRDKDADRYQFLKRQARCDPKMDGRHVWWNIPMRNPKGGSLIGNTLDEAIDAASEPKKGE
ncbi:MAG TPA: hypothetical protein VF783_13840 [Terriglobales bacterium]